MAAPSRGGNTLQTRFTQISTNSDLSITVKSPVYANGVQYVGKIRVREDAITSASQYFSRSMTFNSANDHPETILEGDCLDAMTFWFSLMHNEDELSPKWKMGALASKMDIPAIWHIINAGDKYLFFDDEELADAARNFFVRWYDTHVSVNSSLEADFARSVVLPCYIFDHAEGFTAITKWLAYNSVGHITEKRPVKFKFKHLHLCPPDFVGPRNHARGRLKTVLHRGLWNDIGKLLKKGPDHSTCTHWAETAGQYLAALVKTEAYPLEEVFGKRSIYDLLDLLGNFDVTRIGKCDFCLGDWKAVVGEAARRTRRSFDGLCLDCMDKSKFKKGSTDDDYWRCLGHVDGRWDTNCRVRHGECTWYTSWCGRDEHRQKLLQQHRAEVKPWNRGL